MRDNRRAVFQPTLDLCLKRRAMINFHIAEVGFAFLYHEQAPMLATPKQSTHWYPQHIVTFPDDNATFDTIAVADGHFAFCQIGNDVHALLFNPQGRYLGEG